MKMCPKKQLLGCLIANNLAWDIKLGYLWPFQCGLNDLLKVSAITASRDGALMTHTSTIDVTHQLLCPISHCNVSQWGITAVLVAINDLSST